MAVFLSACAFAQTQPRIDTIEPFRLKVQSAGKVRLEVPPPKKKP